MAYGTRVKFDEVREIAFGDISGAYATVGTPIGDHVRILGFNNGMDEDLYISFDGQTDNLRIASNSFKLYDLSTNRIRDDGLFLAVGTQIYVKEVSSSPTQGDFWVEVMYGEGGR
jgi:hypothetical protein